MKSLQESLFDPDITKKDVCVGDLYEFKNWASGAGYAEVKACDALSEYFISPYVISSSDIFNKYFKYNRGRFSKYLDYEITNQPIFGEIHKNYDIEKLFGYLQRSKFYTASMGAFQPILFAITWIILSSLWDNKMVKNIKEYLKSSLRYQMTDKDINIRVSPCGKLGDKQILLVVEFKSQKEDINADATFWAVFDLKDRVA